MSRAVHLPWYDLTSGRTACGIPIGPNWGPDRLSMDPGAITCHPCQGTLRYTQLSEGTATVEADDADNPMSGAEPFEECNIPMPTTPMSAADDDTPEVLAVRARTMEECLEYVHEHDVPAVIYRLKRGVERQARLIGLLPREGVLE